MTIAIWSDPNGDGNPTDGLLLGSVAGTIQNEGTDTFVNYTFNPPVDVSAFTSFFVGDMAPANGGPEHFFQGIDETPPSHVRSWIAANGDGSNVDINTIGNNDLIGTIDSFGLPGNWLIRADTGGGGGSPTPTPTGTPGGCTNYTFTTGTDPLVPGTTDTGNHVDDGDTFVALPFSFQFYDQTYNGVNVNSNGRLDFVCINEPGGFASPVCPLPPIYARLITRSFLFGATIAQTSRARVVQLSRLAAASLLRCQALRPIASLTLNGAQCISPITI